ncbi:hypothetical protein OMP38_16925 [Cohnella ginsengisoli]|uniref:Uncharacterized protein n=1 Tax=Cohnella ginsengisoli TaxID=425004 RepID=A0A9X4QMR6_9BACL|nr:hypothetical protein [Cohnella ginsengisoli]MDG0792364.1 hypothetical protein [Cohnella ginsengisoli]
MNCLICSASSLAEACVPTRYVKYLILTGAFEAVCSLACAEAVAEADDEAAGLADDCALLPDEELEPHAVTDASSTAAPAMAAPVL